MSVSSARASATPMRRLAKLSGCEQAQVGAGHGQGLGHAVERTMPCASTPP
uniref:hypothetical protein n=1 Tax=Thauera sp. SDU_THAU2 TaxID=3136633 RepID=UPI00311D8404